MRGVLTGSLFLLLFGLLAANAAAVEPATKPSYRVLAQDRGHVAIITPQGELAWEAECKHNSHDIALLENGNLLLHTGPATVSEMTPDKRVVWKYTALPLPGSTLPGSTQPGNSGKVESHAFQRLPDGLTMVAESGNRRLVEVDRAGKIVKEVPLVVDKPHPHRDTRLARKLANGNYLVCHEGDGVVREYDSSGKVVWSYTLDLAGRPRSPGHGPEGHGTEVFSAVRLKNGNTLIGCGNGNRVVEVDKAGKEVWSLDKNDVPGVTLAWVTMVERLPDGSTLVVNCHAGPENPQIIEVTPEKKLVWSFKDFEHFVNALRVAGVL